MSRTTAYINATPEQIFAVLTDATTYEYWVVGCKEIRAVEPEWPAAGAAFHHTVGGGPVTIKDETRIRRIDEPKLLELDAHAWPAGKARVTMIVEGKGRRSRVQMLEEPTSGPAKWVHNPLLDAAAHARNTVCLKRLARLAEGRR